MSFFRELAVDKEPYLFKGEYEGQMVWSFYKVWLQGGEPFVLAAVAYYTSVPLWPDAYPQTSTLFSIPKDGAAVVGEVWNAGLTTWIC